MVLNAHTAAPSPKFKIAIPQSHFIAESIINVTPLLKYMNRDYQINDCFLYISAAQWRTLEIGPEHVNKLSKEIIDK
jgi:hypothetical protein